MRIKKHNFAPSIFLLELSTQCNFAKECDRWLLQAASGWCTRAPQEQFAERRAPRDIMIYCTAFLSAAGVVSKLLFPGRRRSAIHRCKRLRELLDIGESELPVLRDLAVRNAFEHVDERLDMILPSFTQGSFAPVSVSEAPSVDLILKHFDLRLLMISFASNKLSLVDCTAEISRVGSQIKAAFRKLAGREFKIWS